MINLDETQTVQEKMLNYEPEGGRVLVVDDDEITRDFLTHLLGRNYDVMALASAHEALEMLEAQPFDVVLTDVMMPRMSGFDLLTHIREHNTLYDLPVILVTARNDTRDVVHGLELGANDYIPKPFENGVILARIKTQLMVKRLLDERKATAKRMDTLNRVRTQLFRIASHDLKNPINNISMAVHLLSQRLDDEALLRVVNTIETSTEAMSDVIENFLEMLQLEIGEVTMRPAPVNLRDVITHVLVQYEVAAYNKDIELIADDIKGMAYADHTRLVQVVSNLVSNAIKYSDLGQTVQVRVVDNGGAYVRIEVQDNGPGVLPEERHLLFTQFGRPGNRPTAGENSTGLGLWIVRHLTGLQHGEAGAIFPEEGGSIFYVDIPRWERT